MTVRFSEERRAQIVNLADALNCSFVELFEKGIDLVDRELRGKG